MNRFLVVSTYVSPEFSGSGRNAFNFAGVLARENKVTLLSFSRNLGLPLKEKATHVRIRRIPYFPFNILTKAFSLVIILPFYLFHASTHDFILVYGSKVPAFDLLVLSAKTFRKKVIFRSLLIGIDDFRSLAGSRGLYQRWQFRQLKKIDHYFSLNREFTARYLDQVNSPQKVFESPQGVDTGQFMMLPADKRRRIRYSLGVGEDEFVIVSVGFLLPRKGYHGMFRALHELDFGFRYMVVGETDYRGDHFLRSYREDAQRTIQSGKDMLGDRIFFAGHQERVADFLHAADIFLHNAEAEGLSNALLEAMACGTCPVVRKIAGLDEGIFVHSRNIMFFEDEKAIPGIISGLYGSPGKRACIGEEAHKTIREVASFDRVYQRFMEKISQA